jgi:hypothetical protein
MPVKRRHSEEEAGSAPAPKRALGMCGACTGGFYATYPAPGGGPGRVCSACSGGNENARRVANFLRAASAPAPVFDAALGMLGSNFRIARAILGPYRLSTVPHPTRRDPLPSPRPRVYARTPS